MPKAAAKLTISRYWQILLRLPSRAPGLTAAELADYLRHDCGFTLTKRTVERDLVELSTLFPLTSQADTKPFRWRWIEGKKLDVAGLDLADALSLVLAEQAITPLLPAALLQALAPRFALAREKLAALGTHPFSRWTEKVRSVPAALNLQPPRILPEVLATVQEALLRERRFTVAYTAPQAARAKEITLNPLSFIQRGPVPYLVATAFGYDDIRLYALHRMTRPHLLTAARHVPPGYTTDCYLRSGALDFDPGVPIKLRARVSNELAIYLAETPLAPEQDLIPRANHHELRATVRDSWQLRFWLLSQGPALTVLGPDGLRQSIADQLRRAAEAYVK
jgi:predicted DNA-binding transcriptional regulator YafY